MENSNQDKNKDQEQTGKQELNYQKKEEIRMANEGGNGEATPPDLESADHTKNIKSENNFNNVNVSQGKSLEDRDTNDGDANSEN